MEPDDRRKQERRIFINSCSAECPTQKWSCSGKTKDISEGGMCLDILKVPQKKDQLNVFMLDIKGRELIKKGLVSWLKENSYPEIGATLGLQFL